MNSLKLSVLLVLIGYICARPYAWPTNASRTITTVFGDARPRRFHAGMDIRTWGNTGYELYAVDNGYIQRIRTSSKGYGKAVYLKLQDGNTAVYAHLENFSKPLNIAVRKFQEASHSYTIDHYFLPEEFPIKKGEIIGYSGDTGTISGAHLHFEIRDENENPVNPQLLGIQIEDTIPPTFLNLAAIPQFPDSKVGKSPIPVIYPAHPVGNNEFIIEDTLYTTGSVGLAVQVEDKLNDQPFSYGIFSIELRIDGVLWYQRKYDSYSFREEYLSIWDLDYTLKQLTGDKYFRLFHEPGSEIQSFVKFWNPNPTKPEVGIHDYKITASDFSGNTAVITGMIKNLPSSIGMPMEYRTDIISALPPLENGITLSHFNNGIIVNLLSESNDYERSIILKSFKNDTHIALTMQPNGQYYSELVNPALLDGLTNISISPTSSKTASNVYGILVQPDESFQLMSFDETIILSGDEEVFYHPTFVWTYPVPSNNWNNIPNAEFIYTPIAVGPYLVPYKNEIHLKFLKTSEMPSNSGIFYFDADDTKWIYMDTVNDNQFFETTILSGGVFAVISEAIPPIINNVYPKMDSVINSDEMVSITFNILDEFSGIDGERNVSVILDDKSLIFEYNSYNKKVRYDIWNHLSEGKHQIQIEAKDNLGNKTNSTHTFTVR